MSRNGETTSLLGQVLALEETSAHGIALLGRLARALPLFPTWVDRLELMDRPSLDPAILAGNLADLRRVNRWLGGTRLTLRSLARLAADLPPGAPLTVLDVGTGSGDIPQAVVAWAIGRGLQPRVVACDLSPEILAWVPPSSEAIELVVADGRKLPFADHSFDVALSSLALHHLPPKGAMEMLREMRRVARRGVIVNDLVRSWPGYLGAWLLGHLATTNPLTRHDAPLSVRRAYTRGELALLASRAGLGPVSFAGYPGYRVAMVAGGRGG